MAPVRRGAGSRLTTTARRGACSSQNARSPFKFHQDQMLEGASELRPGRAIDAPPAQVAGHADVEQVELGRPDEDGAAPAAAERLDEHADQRRRR